MGVTSGDATVEGFRDLLNAIFEHENWESDKSLVSDHSDLNVSKITADDVRRIAQTAAELRSKFRVTKHAVIAPRNLEYGLSRMWLAYIGEENKVTSRTFRSREEAIAWIST